mgnify:CR=1 FL=1
MKILGISDTTDTLIYSSVAPSLYKDVDMVISAGDLPLRYYDYIATMLNKDVCWVYGNHNLEDWDRMMRRGSDQLKDFDDISLGRKVQMMPRFGGLFTDGKVFYDKERDLVIAGLGGSMLYNFGDSQYSEKQMARRILRIMPKLYAMKHLYGRYCDILITHAPPRGIGDAEDLCHKGFECFLSFMDRYKPKYLLHGHVHLDDMNAPRITQYNQTKVINIYKNFIIDDPELGASRK